MPKHRHVFYFWQLSQMAVVTCIVLLVSATKTNAGPEVFAPHHIQQTNKHTQAFVAAAEKLKAKPESEWTDQELQHYITNALWAVYNAVFTHLLLEGELPSDLHDVVDEGLLAVWPQNPWNDWIEIQVNADGLNFSPGNISLQLCPPSEYSIGPDDVTEVPLSYEIGIFAPTLEFASNYGNAQPYEKNRSWGQVPQGTLYMIGAWAETAVSLREKLAQQKESVDSQ